MMLGQGGMNNCPKIMFESFWAERLGNMWKMVKIVFEAFRHRLLSTGQKMMSGLVRMKNCQKIIVDDFWVEKLGNKCEKWWKMFLELVGIEYWQNLLL